MSIAICLLMITSLSASITQNAGQPQNVVQSGPSPTSGGSGGLADSPWPMFRQNLNHTGLSPYDTSGNTGQLKWSFMTNGRIMSQSPVIGIDGTIYVGSGDGNFYAINPDGTEKWNISGRTNANSAAISSDGTIYVGRNAGNLLAIYPNGIEKWQFMTSDSVMSSPAISSEGTIYVGSDDYNFYAINPDGTEKWRFTTGSYVLSSPAICFDGTVYFGSDDSNLYAMNPNGTKKWNFLTGGAVRSSPAIGSDGTIYFGSHDFKLYAINPDGTEKWNFPTAQVVHSSPAIGSDGTIYVGSEDRNFYAINPNGTEKWHFMAGSLVQTSPAISSDGIIYFGSQDSKLYAFYPNGTEKWSFTAGDRIFSSPAISSDGTIYFGDFSYHGKLYALGDPSLKVNVTSHFSELNSAAQSVITVHVTDGTNPVQGATVNLISDNGGIFSPQSGITDTNGDFKSIFNAPTVTSQIICRISAEATKIGVYNGSGHVDITLNPIPWPMFRHNPNHTGQSPYDTSSNPGKLKWSFMTDGLILSSPAIDFDGTIYVGSEDHKLYAINQNGTQKWNFKTGGHVWSSPTIGNEGTIYVGSWDNKLYAIDPDGTQKWNFTTGDRVRSSPAIGSDGTIYIGSNDYVFYAINPDGTEKWSFTTGKSIISSPAIGFDGTIYIGSRDNKLYAINPDGTEKWNFMTGDVINPSPAIDFDGTIYVGSNDHKLYSIYPNGTERWNFTTDGIEHSSPAIDIDGTIYVGSGDHQLYAIGEGGTPPIADAGPDQTINEGGTVLFDSSASHDPDGTIESYEWDFDLNDGLWWDTGAALDAPGPTPIHVYGDDGVYTVTLRVTDDSGDTDIDECIVTVNNVAPTITLLRTYPDDEGSRVTFEAEAIDPGSDDVTYSWNLEYGPTIENTYYNDWVGPELIYDPATNEIKTPLGIYPFQTSDVESHVYGDNYDYTVTLTVTDDDGGESTVTTTVTVDNLAPSIIEMNIPSQVDEGFSALFEVLASDEGSDDLTFTWDFELGPTITNVHYNDGGGPDPYPSPWGDYPFDMWDNVDHTYGDDGMYTLSISIEDDDGGITTYSTDIPVRNVAPTIGMVTAPEGDEGAVISFSSTATDPGSDDLTFTWNWGDGSSDTMKVHYNDGVGPDPPRSPLGNNPFSITDSATHIYGDDGNYTITLTVEDDNGGITTYTTTVIINNVAPTIESFGPFAVDECTLLELLAISTDPGSDDLTFTWEFELGPILTNIYYNDGLAPDPHPSPWGTYPYSASDMVDHTYGDDGFFAVTLTVTDDDGGLTSFTTNITVNNVAPTIATIEANMYVNFSLRVAGEKYHSVSIHLYEDDVEIWNAQVTRQPGSPDAQAATLSGYSINFGSTYSAIVDYLPNDPRVNGNVWGGNPVWVILEFQDGTTERLHHTFNVRQSYWDTDHWNHIDPWEVDLTGIIYRHNITFEASASDPGSDDLIFIWDFGDGGTVGPNTYFNNGISPDLYPSPDINPMDASDTVLHAYTASGTYTIALTVMDDDGGIATATIVIVIPG